MLGILERQKFGGLLRSRVTLISAIEMFLDPCVIMSCLLATALWFDEPLGAQYMILALLAFSAISHEEQEIPHESALKRYEAGVFSHP